MTRPIRIAPSILSADFAHLARDIERVETAGADILHIDIMDGHFVPNITIGPAVVQCIRRVTNATLDTHLMVETPDRYIDDYARAGANWISVHAEADVHMNRTVHLIQERGLQAGVAINPATSLSAIEEILPEVDYVLIMSVNPGFGGQKFIPSTLQKIHRLKQTIESRGYQARIEVDGGVGPANLQDVLAAGAEIIVAGSAIFAPNKDASEMFRKMKGIAEERSELLEKS